MNKAFPRLGVVVVSAGELTKDQVEQIQLALEDGSQGMDLRDYFAAKAMQALIQSGSVIFDGKFLFAKKEEVANRSFEYADAMMEARKR